MAQAPRMDAAQFDRVASKCRWYERSLNVVRAILVDGVPLADAAAAHEMSPKQARVLLGRFNDKAEQVRVVELEEFMRQEAPRHGNATFEALEPFSKEVRTLRDNGYTVEQVVSFFKLKNITTSATTIRRFLRSIQE
ncbi:hypothetical protein Q8O96_30795 [Pseudomonas sp. LPH60]|uniref:hypothetical protein n=1 Tax=Pseudomonas sp. LPH60 TaxID=3065906 RepID=UPI00273C7FB8|nr:hypothetical protein [Pseudomonas sp. LPH60]MDP4573461.1 hypothetical protein [Pseudomonas sp. LPH60]